MTVENGKTVLVHYRGTLEDGSEFDSSLADRPLEFTLGAGEVIPGFEEAVASMDLGEKKTVTLPPDQAYGDYYDEAVQTVPKEAFAEEPFVDGVVSVMADDGTPLRATITKVEGEDVTLDFNHPLAGKPLTFDLELLAVVEEE